MMQGEEVDIRSISWKILKRCRCRQVSGADQVCDAGLERPGKGVKQPHQGKFEPSTGWNLPVPLLMPDEIRFIKGGISNG